MSSDAWSKDDNIEVSGLTSNSYKDTWRNRLMFLTKQDIKENAKSGVHWVLHPAGRPLLTEIKNNLKSGITVSLVNIPLSISLAIAGGSNPVAGIVTAFWAGIISALLGGSHFNIVGPTGALSGVLMAASTKYQDEAILPFLSIAAGLLCFLVWIFNIDRYVMFIPSSVIHGFTLGVAFIIGLNQLNSAFGLTNVPKGESFLESVFLSLKNIPETKPWSFPFFLLNFITLFLLVRKFPKFPWAIVIALIGIGFGFGIEKEVIPIDLETLHDRFPELNLSLVAVPKFKSEFFNFEIVIDVFTVAFIAILETLISARIADGMTKTKHNQRREVFGVAVANIFCGALGGIPATAALARTALNIKSGATSRLSATINCISVAILGVALLNVFQYIPMPTVAALLVMVAVRMVDFHHLKHMLKYDRLMFGISILSAAFCLILDTMAGILVGAIVSLLLFVDQMSKGHSEVHLNKGNRVLSYMDLKELDKKKKFVTSPKPKSDMEMGVVDTLPLSPDGVPEMEEFGDTIVYRITGQLTFVNGLAHSERISRISEQSSIKNVIISLRYLYYIDLDGVDALREEVEKLRTKEIKVAFSGVLDVDIRNTLEKHDFFRKIKEEGLVFPSYLDALTHIHGPEAPSPAVNEVHHFKREDISETENQRGS